MQTSCLNWQTDHDRPQNREADHTVSKVSGGRAVVERTQGLALDGDMEETALYRSLSYFPSPPWSARAVCDVIEGEIGCLDQRTCWEPAAGKGHLAHGLKDYFRFVWQTDIHDYDGYGSLDFLTSGEPAERPDFVITNPPFPLAADFVRCGLEIATVGVAVLARLAFLESAGRYDLMSRLTLLAPFSERVPMQLGSWDPGLSTATSYAWFCWCHDVPRQPVHMIPPGTRARLTRPSDEAFADGRKTKPAPDESWLELGEGA